MALGDWVIRAKAQVSDANRSTIVRTYSLAVWCKIDRRVPKRRSKALGGNIVMTNALQCFVSRRRFLSRLALAVATLPLMQHTQAQAELPHLDPADPTAKALAYTEDASKVDAKAEAIFKAGNRCGNCSFFQAAQVKAAYAPCLIFPGKFVSTHGWCRSWGGEVK